MDEMVVGFTTIFLLFGTPLIIALLVFCGWLINTNRKSGQADRAREVYERLAREKLDVIKTAIAMGQSDDQIRELDARLERLIGTEQLKSLLDAKKPEPPHAHPELHDADLIGEVDRQSKASPQAE